MWKYSVRKHVTLLIECFSKVMEALGLIPNTKQNWAWKHMSTAPGGRKIRVKDHPKLHAKFKTSMRYPRPS